MLALMSESQWAQTTGNAAHRSERQHIGDLEAEKTYHEAARALESAELQKLLARQQDIGYERQSCGRVPMR